MVCPPCEWMQFTGLLDKNDKEIYEGDIIKYTRYGWRCFRHLKDNTDLITYYAIEWSDRYCAFRSENKSVGGSLIFDDNRAERNEIEVIGNIYQNPELLERIQSQ